MPVVIRRRDDSTALSFFKSTISAQIHLVGAVLAIIGLIHLLHLIKGQSSEHYWACLIYGLTSIFVLGTSATYHFLSDGFHISTKMENWFEDVDHFAIYLFIAGTYTPFVLNSVAPPWRGYLLILVWTIAIIGIVYTHLKPRLPLWAQHRYLYTGIFVALGWTALLRAQEISRSLSHQAAFYLVAGGLCYSIGAVVYALKKPKLFPGVFGFHELWHLAVLGGFALHYMMVISFYQ